jgi:MFS transporter, ACS family, hexuronate transporter
LPGHADGEPFLLGMGEGGGFPAATRVVAEWFPVNERSTAMGIINAGTAVGAVIAPWIIFLVMNYTGWFGLAPWRWVFLVSGGFGLLWTAWWWLNYRRSTGIRGCPRRIRAKIPPARKRHRRIAG